MTSFIPTSKSDTLNIIFQNNYNEIMEIAQSGNAFHSKLVTIFFNKKLLIWDFKLNFQIKPCKINFKNLISMYDKSHQIDVIKTLRFTNSFISL